MYISAFTQVKYSKNEINIQKFDQCQNISMDTAFVFLKKLHQENLKQKDNKFIANSLYLYGKYYFLQQNFINSIIYLNQSEKFALKSNDKETLSYIYNIRGLINYQNGNNAKALEYYQKGLKLTEINNFNKVKSMILLNLGTIYSVEKDTINYIKSLKKCIEISKNEKLFGNLSKAYVSLAQYYLIKNPKETNRLLQLALQQAKIDKNFYLQLDIHINLVSLFLNENKLELMYYQLKKAEEIQLLLNDFNKLFFIYFNYGSYYNEKNNYIESKKYYLKALEISKSTNIPPDRIVSLYKNLAEIYEKFEDYKEANFYNKSYQTLNDSIFTLEKNKIFTELHTKYEVEKKNLKINLLNKNNQIIKNRRNFIIYVASFIFIILIILIILYKNKIKIEKIKSESKQKNYENEIALIHKKKELSEIRAKYQGQNNERNRLSKEIHDGVGGSLAGLRLQLSQVNEELNSEKIEKIISQLTAIFKELRAISHNLNLNYIEETDLKKLLSDFITSYTSDNSLNIQLNIYPDDALFNINKNLKVNLYRIFQELLINTKKHANAKNIEVTITHHENFLNIIYEDDGIGFDIFKNKNGIGLNNIKERILLFNGEINIESVENSGLSVIINVPKNYE